MTEPKMYQSMIDAIGEMNFVSLMKAYGETTRAFDQLLGIMNDNLEKIALHEELKEASLRNLNGLNEVVEAINNRLTELQTA